MKLPKSLRSLFFEVVYLENIDSFSLNKGQEENDQTILQEEFSFPLKVLSLYILADKVFLGFKKVFSICVKIYESRYLHKHNIGEVSLLLRTNHVTNIICLLEHDYGELKNIFGVRISLFFTNYDIIFYVW